MNFTTYKNGTTEGYCVVKTAEVKTNVKGVPYCDLTLSDQSGEINAKIWDYKGDLHGEYAPGDFVKVRGTLSKYNNVDQFRIDRIRHVREEDGVDVSQFVPSSEYPGQNMLNEIYTYIDKIRDEELQLLTRAIIKDNEGKLLFWPAAFKLHHAIRGGLLYHTLSVLKLADAVAKIYPSVDRDLLFSGAILHDICKIDEFDVNNIGMVKSYSVKGELLGHLVMGAMEIAQKAKELSISEEKALLLEHMIISHHGDPEFGAAVRPMTLEAEILSQLDTLDATVYEISAAVSGVEDGEFTQRQWALDNRKLFNHGRKPVAPKANLL